MAPPSYLPERKAPLHLLVRFSVQLSMGVDEVIELFSLLKRFEQDVAPQGELNPVFTEITEVILLPRLVLARLLRSRSSLPVCFTHIA